MLMVSMLATVNMRLVPWCSMCLLALSLLCLPTLHAKIQSVQEAAFMVAGSKLYIQGGKNVSMKPDGDVSYTPQAQLLSLDLSEDWPTTAPKWNTTLAPGASTYLFVGVAATDNRTVITFREDGNTTLKINTYDITSNKWKSVISRTGLPVDIRQAMRAVVDPNTGLVYINSDLYMHVFDPRDSTIKNPTNIEGSTMPLRRFAGAAYLKSLQKIIYLGGLNGFVQYGPMIISQYSPQTEGWSVWETKGDIPSPRTDHCLAANEDGSIVVVYGGRTPLSDPADPATEFTGTIYILDVATATWTQGPSTPSRLYMVCVIIGDQFLAWGGFNGKITTDERPVIYSLTQKQWVESYTAPVYMKSLATVTGPESVPKPSTSVSSPGSTTEDKTSSPNLGAILGGVFGGLFVLTMAGTIHLCLRRREDRAKYNAVSQRKDTTDEKDMTNKKDNSIQDKDRELLSIRNPQKLQKSHFPAVRDPQSVPNDMKFRERVNGPQQHYSENSKCIKVIPQPVKTIDTSGISTAATTASDRPGVSSSLSIAPTVYVHGSGFYPVPVSEARNSTAAMMYYSDADIYNAQPVFHTTVANGVSVYMTPSGQYVALARQPIQTPGAAGYVMGYSGPAMSHSSGTSSMMAEPPSSAHTVFANMPSSTLNSTMYSSMSDSRNSIGYFAPSASSRPKSGYSGSTGPNSTLVAPSSSGHDTTLTDTSTHSSLNAGSMVVGPPSSAHTVFSSMPSSTVNSAVYSSSSDSRNSVGYFAPSESSRSKSRYSDSTGPNSTLVEPSSSGHDTTLTDTSTHSSSSAGSMVAGPPSSAHTVFSSMPSSTVNSAVYSSSSDSRNSIGYFAPPGSSRPKSGYSDSMGFNSTLVAPSSSVHNTVLTDPSSTTNSAMYSSMCDSNSIVQFP